MLRYENAVPVVNVLVGCGIFEVGGKWCLEDVYMRRVRKARAIDHIDANISIVRQVLPYR